MKITGYLINFIIAFVVAFIVNAIVVYLWYLIRYGDGAFNWSLSFYFGIVCGILFAILLGRRVKPESP